MAPQKVPAQESVSQESLTIGQASGYYLAALPSERRSEAQGALGRFIRWYGSDRPVKGIRGHELATYCDLLGVNTPDSARRLEILRSFFVYAKKSGYTATNLGTHIRLRKSGGKARGRVAAQAMAQQMVRLTEQGYHALKADLEQLTEQRPLVAEQLKHAMADKDFRENSPLDAIREHQAHLEARIRELQTTLKHAVIMGAEGGGSGERVELGKAVSLLNLANGAKLRYTIVDPNEVSTIQGRISAQSPVGRAVLDKPVGTEVEVLAPSGRIRFRIESIDD